ncbi:MAG: hypothetical protein K9M56_07345 [Victivallales bacterium]|nr:hypothetical protein [Victivallales bacterium]
MINWLEKIIENFHKKTSYLFLILCSSFWIIILAVSFKFSFPYLVIIFGENKKSLLCIYAFYLLILGLLVILLVWLNLRRIPKFRKNEIGILFAPYNANGSFSKEIFALFQKFKLELSNQDGTEHIKCKQLPFNHKPTILKTAHNLIKKSNAFIVIHGKFCTGNIQSKKVKGFIDINFTAKSLGGLTPVDNRFIISTIGKRAFISSDENSFIDENIIVNNLSDISLYFIALIFLIERNLDRAVEILLNLRNKYFQSKNKNLKNFSKGISLHLAFCYDLKLDELYSSYLVMQITSSEANHIADLYKELSIKSQKLTGNNNQYYIRIAIFYFHYRRIKDAIKALYKIQNSNNAEEIHVKNISLAFLYMWEKNYQKSLEFYRKSHHWIRKNYIEQSSKIIVENVITFIKTILRLYVSVNFAPSFN